MSEMTTADILDLALKKEQTAYRFYDRMLSQTKVKLLTDLLLQLREEEQKHVVMVQKKITQMNLG